MAQTILGIDLGSHSVKVCYLSRSLRDFELLGFYEQAVGTSTRLTPEEATAVALRSIIEKNELKADIVSVGLPAHHLSCRVLELPFTNVKKIEQTIEFELEGHVPLPLEDLVIDYHILSIDENRSTVLVAYLTRAKFIKYLDLLQSAGVDPKYVGVDAVDFSNIGSVAMVPPASVYAMVNIGHEKTDICIMEGPKVLYVRSVSLGGAHFTRAIQKAFKLNFEKAESMKIDRGRVSGRDEEPDQISRICHKVGEELAVAIRQTYLGFKQIYPQEEWAGLYFTGGGSRLSGLPEFLSTVLKLNVLALDCLGLVPHHLAHPEVSADVIIPSLTQTLRVIFSNRAAKINFRRGEFASQKEIKALGSEIKQAAVWMVVVVLMGIGHFLYSYHTLSERVDELNKGITSSATAALPELKKDKKSKSIKQLLNNLNGKIADVQAQLDALEIDLARTPLSLLLEFSKMVPSKEEVTVDIDDFTFNGETLQVEGRTTSFEAVDKIKNALGASTLFQNVTTQSVNKGVKDNEVKFTLTIEVGLGQGEG